MIAVTPQPPDNSLSQNEKEGLTFQVLSDPNSRVAENYNILFELPDYLQDTYTNRFKLDLAVFNNAERWVLPIPATFILNKNGVVHHAYVNPDYMKRMEPQEIIDQLKML